MVQRKKNHLTPQLVFKLLLLLLIIAVISLLLGDYGFYSYWKTRHQETQARIEQEYLRTVEQEKARERDRLQNDMEYIEKIAREKYRMSKKGEIVYRVIDKSAEAETSHQ
jgi:cell division protein FtsB